MAAESKTAWTPGEWQVSHGPDTSGYPVYRIHGFSADEKRDARLHDANARLISKAPELAEALQQTFDALCSLATIANGEMPSWSEAFEHDALKVDAAQNKARALLQQIRGEA